MNKVSAQRGWVVFDWANSAYSLVIVSTVFPQVFSAFLSEDAVFLGIDFHSSDALYTFSICFSFFVISILSPFLSGIADFSNQKKRFMQFFTSLGCISCACLYFFSPEYIWIGVLGAVLASIGYSGSMVFYNAFLPEIAHESEQDSLSAKGYSYGYVGSSLLLITLLVLVSFYEELGFASELGVFKWGFVLVGLWWFGWSRWTFKVLADKPKANIPVDSTFKKGFQELQQVWKNVKNTRTIKQFLWAFFMTTLGLQTLIIVAPLFAITEVGLGGSELIVVVLIMQFLGVAGAWFFSKVSMLKGNVVSLMASSMVYLFICITAFLFVNKTFFYVQAGLMGFALGGMQSQARSGFSKLLSNVNQNASYFSFYDVLEKVATVIGTFIYAALTYFLSEATSVSAPRIGILILGVFFTFGFILWLPLKKTPELRGIRAPKSGHRSNLN